MVQLSVSESTTRLKKCTHCRSRYLYLYRTVQKAGKDYASVYIEAHTHHGELEAYFTVVLGIGSEQNDKHTTFACRYGYVEDAGDFACSLIDVPETYDDPYVGKKLTRAQALKSPKLENVWNTVDYLLEYDIVLHDFFYHTPKSKLKSLLHLYK